MKTKPVIYRQNWFSWNRVWVLWLKSFAHFHGFHYSENQSEIQIPVRYECMIRLLELTETEYEVESPTCWN